MKILSTNRLKRTFAVVAAHLLMTFPATTHATVLHDMVEKVDFLVDADRAEAIYEKVLSAENTFQNFPKILTKISREMAALSDLEKMDLFGRLDRHDKNALSESDEIRLVWLENYFRLRDSNRGDWQDVENARRNLTQIKAELDSLKKRFNLKRETIRIRTAMSATLDALQAYTFIYFVNLMLVSFTMFASERLGLPTTTGPFHLLSDPQIFLLFVVSGLSYPLLFFRHVLTLRFDPLLDRRFELNDLSIKPALNEKLIEELSTTLAAWEAIQLKAQPDSGRECPAALESQTAKSPSPGRFFP